VPPDSDEAEIAFHHMKHATNGLFPHQVAFYGARGHVLDDVLDGRLVPGIKMPPSRHRLV